MMLRLVAIGCLVLSTVGFAQDRDPIGESADYVIDRDRNRTSGLIQRGSMMASVSAELPEEDGQRVFEVTINYNFRVLFGGTYQGSCALPVRAEFFTQAFIEQLRETEIYETPYFKVRHTGYGDASNLDGNVYPNCDTVQIYDIDSSLCDQLFVGLSGQDEAGVSVMEDLVIDGMLYQGEPVLGAVKLDFSGRMNGTNFKAGADYTRQ